MSSLTDSHCHLDFSQFDSDRDQVVQRAREAGVQLIVNPGYDLESSRRAVALAERYPEVYAAVGVHPHEAKAVTDEVLAELRRLAAHPKVVAIGEMGLDFYRDLSPRDAQRQAFRQQLALAAELELPVIVHSREAHDDVMAILTERFQVQSSKSKAQSSKLKGVLHAFSGGRDMAEKAFELGFLVGIAGPVTFENAHRLRALVRELPLERLLVETDAPYLAPHPYRGKRNEPARVALVAATVAEVQGVSGATVIRQTTANARRLFRRT
ncbi:MAG: TatD family hydrolase [Anaerolineae bacterium]|nr:TatD family hydrolase [Anaerolineae bacterium]